MHNQFKTQKFKHLMLAMGARDLNSAPYSPVHYSSHSMTSFQSSELTELPVVENGQLFAQRVHKSSVARGHMGGATGVPGVWTRDPRHRLGGPCTRKKLPRTWVQIHTQHPKYAKKV